MTECLELSPIDVRSALVLLSSAQNKIRMNLPAIEDFPHSREVLESAVGDLELVAKLIKDRIPK